MLESAQRQTEPFFRKNFHVTTAARRRRRRHIAPTPPFLFVFSAEATHGWDTSKCPNKTHDGVAHSLAQSRLCLSVEAQRGFVETEFLSSGSPQGLSSPMLVVIFLSSLFTSLFSFFLNYLKCYLSNNEIWKDKKKKNLSFLCILFMETVLCVLSLSVP